MPFAQRLKLFMAFPVMEGELAKAMHPTSVDHFYCLGTQLEFNKLLEKIFR